MIILLIFYKNSHKVRLFCYNIYPDTKFNKLILLTLIIDWAFIGSDLSYEFGDPIIIIFNTLHSMCFCICQSLYGKNIISTSKRIALAILFIIGVFLLYINQYYKAVCFAIIFFSFVLFRCFSFVLRQLYINNHLHSSLFCINMYY